MAGASRGPWVLHNRSARRIPPPVSPCTGLDLSHKTLETGDLRDPEKDRKKAPPPSPQAFVAILILVCVAQAVSGDLAVSEHFS